MLLSNWLGTLSSHINKRFIFRSRDRRALRQRWQAAVNNQISTTEVLEDRTMLTTFLQGELLPDPLLQPRQNDYTGQSVAVSGSWMAVGAPEYDTSQGGNSGAVYLYVRNQSGTPSTQADDTWDFHSTLLSTDSSASGNQFGIAVDIDGDRLIIGEVYGSGTATVGTASIYKLTDPNTTPTNFNDDVWVYVNTLSRTSGSSNALFGSSVSISGTTAIVGAKNDSSGYGSAWVFDTDDDWSSFHTYRLYDPNVRSGDHYGTSVSVSNHGNTLVIGAPNTNFSQGAVTFFERSDKGTVSFADDTWTMTSRDSLYVSNSEFGYSVDISNDEAIIGARYTDSGGTNSGAAHIFKREGNWSHLAQLRPSGLAAYDEFGTSVSIDGKLVVVGSPFEDDGGSNSGSAYIFDGTTGWSSTNLITQKVNSFHPSNSAYYGTSVSVSGGTVVVGAPRHTHFAPTSGAAFAIGVNLRPEVTAINSPDVGFAELGDRTYSFTVTYSDDSAIDFSTINLLNVSVYAGAIGAPTETLTLLSAVADLESDGSPITVTYTVEPPGGAWDLSDEGIFTISFIPGPDAISDNDVSPLSIRQSGVNFNFNVPEMYLHSTLNGGNLEISQFGNPNSMLSMSVNGNVLTVTDPSTSIAAPAGGTQVDQNTFTIPVGLLTGGVITVTGGTGSDNLTVDTSLAAAGLQVVYAGGGGAGFDTLELTGAATSTEYIYDNANDGGIRLNGSITDFVSYTGLEPITSTINATNVTLTYSNVAETITVTDATGGKTTVTSTAGETTTFINPTGTLTIDTGGGAADTINVNSLDSTFDANLTISPGPADTVNIGTIDIGSGDLNLDGIVNFNGAFTTTGLIDIEADGDLTFAAGASATAGAGGIILFTHMDLHLGLVSTSGDVDLEATGAIIDTNLGSNNINAINATLISGTGIGAGDALETTITALKANAGGGLEIRNSGVLTIGITNGINGIATAGLTKIIATDTLTIAENISVSNGILQLENTNGDFNLNGTAVVSNTGSFIIDIDSAGALTMEDGTQIISSGAGLIDVDAVLDIGLSLLETSGDVQLTSSTGKIIDNTASETSLINSETAHLQAATGLGDSDAQDLDTEVNQMTVSIPLGPIEVSNFGELFVHLNAIPAITIDEDALEQIVNLAEITTARGASQPLRVIATSNTPSLIPDPQVNYFSADTTDSLAFTPILDQSGIATITVIVEDGGLDKDLNTTGDNRTISLSFEVHVNSENDAPTMDMIDDLTILKNTPEQTINMTGISAGPAESQPLRITAESSNTGLITHPVINYTSADSTGSLTFTPESGEAGTATITVTVEDGGLDGDLNTTEDNATFIREFEVIVQTTATIELRVVDSPTVTDVDGVVTSLPANQDWVNEWSSYWVEIWVNTQDLTSQGIDSVNLDLSYHTEYTTATEIQFGPGFTQNQTGTINDQTGMVENLYAETAQSDLGINSQLLFARIKFEPLADDQVELDVLGKSIGPYDFNFQINSQQVELVRNVPVRTNLGQESNTSVYANPFDLNDDDKINYRDLILFVGVYGAIPSESDSDYAWAADLNQSDRVDYRDLISFVGNYGKGKANDPDVNYPSNYPDAWANPLHVSLQPQSETNSANLTQTEADQVLEKAIEQVSEKLTPEMSQALSGVEVKVVDLSGATLGRAVPGTIYLDVNAAGYGWFVDFTPLDHSEFTFDSQFSLIALPESAAAGRIDLWTVILHELGHLVGYEHEAEGVMEETLAPGVRKLAEWNQDSDLFFASVQEEAELLPF